MYICITLNSKLMKFLKFFFLVIISVLSISVFANDGVFYSQGGNLYPKKETTIQLKREILKFTFLDTAIRVDVFFEFYNPGQKKTETVGFVTPPSAGDIGYTDIDNDMFDYELKHPQIFDFYAIVNGAMQPWKVYKASESGFRKDGDSYFEYDYIYHFNATFKPGKNTIQHSYIYKGSSSVEVRNAFFYRITTAKMWANGQIDDFELLIEMPALSLYLPWTFKESGEAANWEVIGIGKLKDGWTDFLGDTVRLGYLKSGMIRLHEKNFKPDFDLHFGILQYFNILAFEAPDIMSEVDIHFVSYPYFYDYEIDDLELLNEFELYFLRNFIYAMHGYAFQHEESLAIFSLFSWYYPRPWLNDNIDDLLSDKEKKLIEDILEIEKTK